jgi:hypothetical protein
MNLTLLAPDIQEEILFRQFGSLREKHLRAVTSKVTRKSAFEFGFCFFHNLKPSANSTSRFDTASRLRQPASREFAIQVGRGGSGAPVSRRCKVVS